MKAVILCGGVGSRLRPLTETTPKPLIPVLGVPVLEQILHKLVASGWEEITLSLGYKAGEIRSFAEKSRFRDHLRFCEEPQPLGTAGGVKFCLGHTREDVLIVSGDNLFDFDLDDFLRFHREKKALFSLAAVTVDDPRPYGTVLTAPDGRITGFCEKPSWEKAVSRLINTGVYLMNGAVLDLIPENKSYDFSDRLFPALLRENRPLYCYTAEGFWGDVGSVPALCEITKVLLDRKCDGFLYRGELIEADRTDDFGNQLLAPSLIAEDASLGEANRIGPSCVIGAGTSLGKNCVVQNAIIGNDTVIGDHTDLFAPVIHDRVKIGAHCVIEKEAVLGYGVQVGNFSRILSGVRIWPGKTVEPEAVIDRDLFFESPQRVDADVFGMSGTIYSQFTLADAIRLGQAVGSLKNAARVGVACDATAGAEIYKTVFSCGVRASGTICYDFEEIFKAQVYFYAAYCALDAFVYISGTGDTLNISFFGAGGLPVSERTAREIDNLFKYGCFSYAGSSRSNELFRMHLLSTAYTAVLQRCLGESLNGMKVRVECENRTLKHLFDEFLRRSGAADAAGGLQFLLNAQGTEMYCLEGDRFYSGERIRTLMCTVAFAEGRRVIVPEDASFEIETLAKKYGAAVLRLYENADVPEDVGMEEMMDNLWAFDAVFLCVRLLHVMLRTGMRVSQLLEDVPERTVRKKIVEMPCPSGEIAGRLRTLADEEKSADGMYYRVSGPKACARLRQMGNAGRIRMLVEAASMESARELSGEVMHRLLGASDPPQA